MIVASYTNDLAVLEIDGSGAVASLTERATGRQLVKGGQPAGFVSAASQRNRIGAVSAVAGEEGRLRLKFPDKAGELEFKVTSFGLGWTVEIVGCTVDRTRFPVVQAWVVKPTCTRYAGKTLNMLSDEASGVIVRAYGEDLNMALDSQEVRVELLKGEEAAGRRFGIVAGPRERLVGAMKAMTRAAGAPVSSTGGAWSMEAPINRRASTLFADVTEDNVDATIEFAKSGHFGIIHFQRWWERLGSYSINPKYYPNGIDGLKRCAEKVRASGMRSGMHTLTACLAVNDPWVAERLEDLALRYEYELESELSAEAEDSLTVKGRLKGRHDTFLGYSSHGNVLKIGDELIQYSGIEGKAPVRFTGLKRAAFRTKRAAHPAGAKVGYLRQRYNSFVPRPGTKLAADIAGRISTVFRTCGHEDIYFDGAEALGPGMPAVMRSIFESLGASPVVESSHWAPHCWWYRSRTGTWDHPKWAPKRFHDLHVKELLEMRKADLLAVQSGWWCPLGDSEISRGFSLDEMEYFAGKNAAYDLPTTIHAVPIHKGPLQPGVIRQMEIFGMYERFRLECAFSDEALKKLAVFGDEYRLRKNSCGEWRFRKVEVRPHRVSGPDGAETWKEAFGAKPSGFGVRIEALYDAERPETAANKLGALDGKPRCSTAEGVRLSAEKKETGEHGKSLVLRAVNDSTVSRGVWAEAWCDLLGETVDGGDAQAFGLWVKGDGKGELLNVQLRTPRNYGGAHSDHYIRVDFTGWRYVRFLLRERDAEGFVEYGWPGDPMYLTYRNWIKPRHISRVSYWLNDLPAGGSCEVEVTDIEPLVMTKVVRKGGVIVINGVQSEVPFEMTSGDYAEYEEGVWRHFDATGADKGRADATVAVELKSGENEVRFIPGTAVSGTPRSEITLFALGEEFAALKDEG